MLPPEGAMSCVVPSSSCVAVYVSVSVPVVTVALIAVVAMPPAPTDKLLTLDNISPAVSKVL